MLQIFIIHAECCYKHHTNKAFNIVFLYSDNTLPHNILWILSLFSTLSVLKSVTRVYKPNLRSKQRGVSQRQRVGED